MQNWLVANQNKVSNLYLSIVKYGVDSSWVREILNRQPLHQITSKYGLAFYHACNTMLHNTFL